MQSDPDEDLLTRTLNSLLASLKIPLVLQSPLELTPSHILTIFESMLRMHLPISPETRKCWTHAARVEAMKIFIGVLEDDVLGIDVGLGDVDPRKLAEGRREEVIGVVETLCWLGKKMNYISRDGLSIGNVARSREVTFNDDEDVRGERPGSPSTLSAMSTQTEQDSSLLVYSSRSFDDSQTTVTTHLASEGRSQLENAEDTIGEDAFSILGDFSPLRRERRHFEYPEHVHTREDDDVEEAEADLPPLRRPSRRYDFESDNSDVDDSYCHCESELSASETSSTVQPVRTTGYLELVDLDRELREFELRRKRSPKRSPHLHRRQQEHAPSTPTRRSSTGIITRHTSPLEHNLALLDERARLLSELAKLRYDRG